MNQRPMPEFNHSNWKARYSLLKVLKDRREPSRRKQEARELYETVGTGACDYETIQRFVIGMRECQ